MTSVEVVCIGKLKEKYWRDAQEEYLKRLSRFCRIRVTELEEERAPDSPSPAQEAQVRAKEAERIRKALARKPWVIALDLDGKMPDSPELAKWVGDWQMAGHSDLAFVIGGSTGLDAAWLKEADFRMCLSRLTFPHQLARVLLLEQVFRAFKIMGNETYHK